MVDMVETMAYYGETPWHNKGHRVDNRMTSEEMMSVSGADYEVYIEPSYWYHGGEVLPTGDEVLYRMVEGQPQILSNVTAGWIPNQNKVAFDFFREYVAEGQMEMETAGVLSNGQFVWALAKIKGEGFELANGRDVVNGYFLFLNPHKYGWSITTCLTPIRVVCWNTLTLAISKAETDQIVRVNHRREFIAKDVRKKLLVAKRKIENYKKEAEYLISRRAQEAAAREYFRTLLPLATKDDAKKEKTLSKGALKCVEALQTQPGAELGEGTWWQVFNAFTYYTDHLAGKDTTTVDTRLTNAWFGTMKTKKNDALGLALTMASESALV